MRCIGARERCACATSCTICDSTVSAPTLSARITSAPLPFSVAPMTLSPGPFSTGIGSPVSIDSSTLERPSRTTPSTGTFSPGRTRSRSPTCTCVSGMSSSVPSSRRRRAVLGARPQQRLDRRRGPRARLELQQLPEQRQRDDDRGRLEVHADAAVRRGTNPGTAPARPLRPRCKPNAAPTPCRSASTCSDCDCAIDCAQRSEERPARPQHDGCRQREFEPGACGGRQERAAVPEHRERQHDQRSAAGSTRSAGGNRQFRILVVVQAGHHRLERHAADRADARGRRDDLGMHRAGVFRARWGK